MTIGNILMWAADVNLVFSYWLLGRKKMKIGFFLSVMGSICFAIAGLITRLPAIWVVNIIFALINGYNLWKLYNEPCNPPRRKHRYLWFGSGM